LGSTISFRFTPFFSPFLVPQGGGPQIVLGEGESGAFKNVGAKKIGGTRGEILFPIRGAPLLGPRRPSFFYSGANPWGGKFL